MSQPLVFLDTHSLIAVFDSGHAAQQTRARDWYAALWVQRCGRISTQVLNEFYQEAITRFPAASSAQDARAEVRRLRQWSPPHLDRHTVDGAWALQDRYHLSYWDALIVSSAHAQGCSYVLSPELGHELQIESVTIIDPFQTEVASILGDLKALP